MYILALSQGNFKMEKKEELSTVRIKKIVLKNFKSVEHGEIVLPCGKSFVPANTKSDILGVYGQNGSGKTALIEALRIMRQVVRGYRIPPVYAECINVNTNISELEFWFDMQWPDGICADIVYKFTIETAPNDIQDEEVAAVNEMFHFKQKVVISKENLSYRLIKPEKANMKVLFNINSEDETIRSTPSMKNLFSESAWKTLSSELGLNRRIAERESRSTFFYSFRDIDKAGNKESIEYKIIRDLVLYATAYLVVIDTKSFGIIQTQLLHTIYDETGIPYSSCVDGLLIEEEKYNSFKSNIAYISNVINTIIPNTSLTTKDIGKQIHNNREYLLEDIICTRIDENGKETSVPLKYESDGVRRIVSFILCYVSAFNQKSFTLAIDEIDSGIFEYLLGELLQAFEESGKGQLIFTSHNLRPLEVISKDSIYFTTTNSENRYVQMKGVHSTNNLRNLYFREILTNSTQNEELYSGAKRYRLVNQIRQTGAQIEAKLEAKYEQAENNNNPS